MADADPRDDRYAQAEAQAEGQAETYKTYKTYKMLTLFTTLISFFAGGVPKILDFFQDRSDKGHELAMAGLQTERELKLHAAGLHAQAQIEEIRTDQIQYQQAGAIQQAAYQHDVAIGQGASQWVINARAMVRPTVTYGLLALLVFIDVFGFYYALSTGVAFSVAMDHLWDQETEIIWASVVSFWFGTQAFARR